MQQRQPMMALQALYVPVWSLSSLWITQYYRSLVRTHGLAPQALDEREADKSFGFYQQLFTDVPLPKQASVLDIGSGMGDLLSYLQSQDLEITDFLGIDLVPEFVQYCRTHFPAQYQFQRANFADPWFQPKHSYDLVVSVGTLVSRVFMYETYLEYAIGKMLRLARRHVLFNLITEVDRSLGNYTDTDRVGRITYIPRERLLAILDRLAAAHGATYQLRELRIYPDGTDAFVCFTLPDAAQ